MNFSHRLGEIVCPVSIVCGLFVVKRIVFGRWRLWRIENEEIEELETERDKMIQIREDAMDDLLTGRVCLSPMEV